MEAIKNFPTPKNITGVRAFHGLTQGFSDFTHELSLIDKPIRECLSTKNAFHWGPDQAEAMQKIKDLLTSDLVLKNFNPALETQLITDASRVGIGFLLRQREAYGKWRLVQCGSRALNGPESRYAVCEIEALGIMHAIQKCRHYLLGMMHFEVLTDHKSLKGVFEKDLAAVENVRLRRCLEKLQEFSFHISYIEGKNNKIADTLSRFPVTPVDGSTGGLDASDCICKSLQNTSDTCYHEQVHSIRTRADEPDPKLQELIDQAKTDPNYQKLVAAVTKYKHFGKKNNRCLEKIHGPLGPGPEGTNLDPSSEPGEAFWKQYQKAWGFLSIHQTGLLTYNQERIVVPEPCRQDIICEIHKSHQGTSKSKWRLRRDFWWPGYSKDIEAHVKKCKACIKFLPSQRSLPVINQNVATYPMEIIGIDLCQSGSRNFLVMVDQFSGFPMVQQLTSIASSTVLQAMSFYFCLFGYPRVIISDQGRQLTSKEYINFLSKRGIKTIHTSAYHPQANGLAEAAVDNVKKLFEKYTEENNGKLDWDKFNEGLLHWRDTPNECGYSPGDIFFARRMKTSLPTLPGKNSLCIKSALKAAKARKELRSKQYGKLSSQDLESIEIGTTVIVQDHEGRKRWNRKATVVGKDGPRGYKLKMEDGQITTRTRQRLKVPPSQPAPYYVIPDDWIESELDAIDPSESAAEISDDEDSDLEEDQAAPDVSGTAEAEAPHQVAPALRRSSRATKGKNCQSCPGCRLIYNYLNVVDNFTVTSHEEIQPVLIQALYQPE